jgi:glycerol uptake facilitator-like aquaporin
MDQPPSDLGRRAAAEGLGTAFLLAAIVGSGIMAERLAGGNVALALLANTLASIATLGVLILVLAPVSGAHFNPAVTLSNAAQAGLPWTDVPVYIGAQITGAFAGTAAANLMFALPVFSTSGHARTGASQLFSEFVATFGLLLVVHGCSREGPATSAYAIAAYVAGAYWFTASTSFANPAVTLARAASDTFAGIRPADVPGFIAAQMVGAAAATALARWLFAAPPEWGGSALLHDEEPTGGKVS